MRPCFRTISPLVHGLSASLGLRYRSDCPHPEERGRIPAMLALVRDVNGEPIAVHRTFLRRDGSAKAEVEPQKATLGPYWGGAARLDPLARELAVAEGIESAASAGRICLGAAAEPARQPPAVLGGGGGCAGRWRSLRLLRR